MYDLLTYSIIEKYANESGFHKSRISYQANFVVLFLIKKYQQMFGLKKRTSTLYRL